MTKHFGSKLTTIAVALAVLATTVVSIGVEAVAPSPAAAGVYFNDTEFTYKEYWADHSSFTAGCGENESAGNSFYIEPDGCLKEIFLDIPDDVDNAIAAVINVNLWRNRSSKSARFTINDGPQYRPAIGRNFSRTPFTATVPLTELTQGLNSLKFQEATGPYHVQDVMIRVYYDDAANQIFPGPNSDVTPPSGSLVGVSTDAGGPFIDPSVGGSLQVDGNQVFLRAEATGAAYVEFHAFYEGYDEDNDGVTLDWHNFLRNNWGPGGTAEQSTGATIGHIGTDATESAAGFYEATWNMPEVINQSGVKFKIRVVDNSGNAVEAAGGVSADFSLDRTYEVESYTIPNFPDQALYFDNEFPQLAELEIDLPTDLANIDRAILLGNYWNSPDLSINDNPPFQVFQGPEDTWETSKRELDVNLLRPGTNTLQWNYRPPGFGAMIEAPGPMIVIHRDAPSGPPVVTEDPEDVLVASGEAATLSVAASGAQTLSYQWRLNGTPIVGATSAEYTTPALLPVNDGAKYDVVVTNGQGSATSAEATVTLASIIPPTSEWLTDPVDTWDYRAPLTVFPESIARTDKVVEQEIDFSDLMATAGSGGPTFDPNSIRVVEVQAAGDIIGEVPFQFEPGTDYDPVSNAVGTLLWQLTGATAPGQPRYFHVYFDKTYKGIQPANVVSQITRTDVVDQGFDAYQFDLADGTSWIFHLDGGGFGKIIDQGFNDWISWNPLPETQGDFRGLPNAVKPPAGYFHPGRSNKTNTTIISEGPLRTIFESRARDNSWISVWYMYPDSAELAITRANTTYYVQYEGTPGGEVDAADQLTRSDGTVIPYDGQYEADLPGSEWMYLSDTNDGRSFFMAHHQNDGAVESYRLLNGEMPIAAFGRGGLNLNSQYLTKVIDGGPHRFTFGLATSTDLPTTSARILDAYKEVTVSVGAPTFNGTDSGAVSDDFSSSTLDPVWTVTDPQADTTLSLTGSTLLIDIPSGVSHDLWEGRDFAPRLMQNVGDEDLDIVVGFASVPAERFEGQGLLFWQDVDNWVRLSVEHDGTRAKVVAYQMVDGDASQVAKKNLPGVATRFLRVIRSGDTWTFQRSYNGTRWFTLPTADIPLNLTQAGIVVTTHSTSTSPAFLAEVDFFESKTSGDLNDDAPQISNVNVAVESHKATVTWDTNVDADTVLDHGPTTQLTERETDLTLTMAHSVTIDYLRCDTPYFVRPRSSSDIGTTIDDLISFTTDACPTVQSDDFSSGSLAPFWTLYDPVGDVGLSLSDQNVVLSVPAVSEHNLFTDENQATRLRQPGPIGDFSVEAKFETVLNKRFQIQGIVVEEDEDSFLRFEVHHDGTQFRTYAIGILDNVPTTDFHYGVIPASADNYIRVDRTGNTWTMSYSADGVTWNQVASLVVPLESIYVGPYVGNTATGNATPPAVLGSIDYFFNTDNPIVPEDGGAGPDLTPPVISDIVATTASPTSQSATVTWTTDEPATTRVDWGLTSAYGDGPLVENTAKTSHVAVIEPVICGTTYHFGVSSNDAAGNTGTGADQTFATPACPGGAFSDNFDSAALDARWFIDDPRGDSSYLLDGDLLTLSVPAGVRHDLTPNNNGALRILQAVPDSDFVVEAGFESSVDFQSQLQGLVFESDDDNLVRFDLFSDGSATKAFVGVLGNNLSVKANTTVPGAAPSSLRVTRVGSQWTFEYSPDRGTTWQTVWTGTINQSVARIGPFAGNANPTVVNVPPHSALVDYFLSDFDPIVITGPGQNGPPEFTIWDGKGGTLAPTESLTFGSLGLAQPDINVRGRVIDSDGLRSVTYAVNGGEPTSMGIGSTDCELGVSCTRRLALDGDINADVNSALLNPGINTVTLRAVDEEFNVSTVDVLVDYTPNTSWPLPYNVDWSTTTDLYDVTQPIDGVWSTDGSTVHIDEIGYDRLLAVGDNGWSSFEAEVPITINSFDPEGYEAPSGGPGVGFIPHWRGHTQAEFAQPKYGFSGQIGALVWYRYRDDVNAERLEIRDSNATLVAEDLSGFTLDAGTTYIFKMQAETGGGEGPLYRLKVWEQGTAEPAGWNIVTALPPSAPDTGSLVLVAHHVDANFGNLDVREITAEAPAITPTAEDHTGLVKVEMSTGTRAAEIRYTLDDTEPDQNSLLFTEPFFISESTTIRAKTFRSGFNTSSTTVQNYNVFPAPDRVTDGLEALYRFDEDGGTVVGDTSQSGAVHDLTIEAGSDVTWLPENDGIRVNGPSLIRSAGGVNEINTDIQASQAFTVEMWIDPSTFDIGDATLFNLGSESADQQNFELAQDGRALTISTRTANTNNDGKPSLSSGGVLPPQLHHLVYVMRADNSVSLYIDGDKAWDGYRGGSLNPWANGYGLSLVNSIEGVNPWVGDLYLAAVYSEDLNESEITQNYQAGPFPPPANYAPIVSAGPDITLVEGEIAQMAATASDDGNPVPPGTLTTTWTQVSGPATAVFSDNSAADATVTLPAAGTYEFEWTGDDSERSTSDTMQIVVITAGSEAPAPSIDPATGSYPGAVTVTMASTVPGAEVRYTTNGDDPTAASDLYTGPFDITETTTVKARAFRTGLADSQVTTRDYTITINARVTDDLLAFYPFNEANGASIKDKQPSPLNLTIQNVGRTTRVESGVRIDQATLITTTPGATKINSAVKSSDEVTIEMWVEPSDLNQDDAVMFGISINKNARNIGIWQELSDTANYLRSTTTNTKGEPPTTGSGVLQSQQIHLVYTRDASGVVKIYRDGVEISSGTSGGNLGNWINSHRMHLGAERDGTRPWLGTYYLLAVYDRALTPNEVLQNFAFGDV